MHIISNNVVANQIDPQALPVVQTPQIYIYTLGTLQVMRGTQAVSESDWHTRQARQLLKILVTERPRPVSTDRLIEILWPTSTPDAAATTLRSAINALRNVVEPERLSRAPSTYIITQAPGYAFPGHPNIWLDVAVFEQMLNQVAHSTDPAQRQKLLEAALELYKDDYLTSDPYADWVQNERERLRERFFEALLQWAELQAAAGHHTAAIATCRRILARDEVRESAYQALMRYQAEAGDSAAALLTYERCRTILAEELGADPSPLTQQWHQRILNGEIQPQPQNGRMPLTSASLRSPGGVPVRDPQTAQRGQSPFAKPILLPQSTILPVLGAHFFAAFVGREREITQLEALRQAAFAGKGGLALLEGEAGVGKTRLAWHVLQQAVSAGATVISAACQPLERQLPFAPLADSIGRYVDSLSSDTLPALPAASLAQLAQIIPSLHDRLPNLPALPGDGAIRSDDDRQRLVDGLLAFITALARARPLVLLLDDLQWADADTLAVLGRLAARLADLPILLLLAYRSDDLAENEALATLRHTLRRSQQPQQVRLERLTPEQVRAFVQAVLGQNDTADPQAEQRSTQLAASLYHVTQGNALFVTEALRDLLERQAVEPATNGESVTLRRNQRVQEIILERIGRLPEPAQTVLRVVATIGRDFSLELLERAALNDPATGLDVLLQRKFLLERPDERLDFSHQIVRQVAYDSLNTLTRRRLHQRVADALVSLGRVSRNPNEVAFHYQQAGEEARLLFAEYSVLGGEFLLRNYGFRQAIEVFDRALPVLESGLENSTIPGSPARVELIRRALQGRGLAYESLYDSAGVTAAYGRLLQWAQQQGDRQLMLTAHSRRATMLNLLGQQREGNEALHALLRALTAEQKALHADPATHPQANQAAASLVLTDLMERRQRLYRVENAQQTNDEWAGYILPPPPVADPVGDLLHLLGPVHAVLPLLDYGWVLLVQGQPSAATHCLEAVVELATQTAQPSIASTALHQLAVTARMLGDWEQSQTLNEQSVAINRSMQGTAAELASMWPRTGSALLSLEMGKVDEAERRLRRVTDFLNSIAAERPLFLSYRQSADIGLGLVALARGDLITARRLLESGLADAANFYPYTHVRGLLGLARLAHRQGENAQCVAWLQQALYFAGSRSLLEEYVATLLVIAELRPPGAPLERLLRPTLQYVHSLGLHALSRALEQALEIKGEV